MIQPVDLSDRDHFRVHLGAGDPGLYIGPAVLGRTSSRYILPVSRRISGPNGEFLGVLVFLITPDTLTRLHKTMDLGAHDMIALVGLDNVIRARFAGDSPDARSASARGLPAIRRRCRARRKGLLSARARSTA